MIKLNIPFQISTRELARFACWEELITQDAEQSSHSESVIVVKKKLQPITDQLVIHVCMLHLNWMLAWEWKGVFIGLKFKKSSCIFATTSLCTGLTTKGLQQQTMKYIATKIPLIPPLKSPNSQLNLGRLTIQKRNPPPTATTYAKFILNLRRFQIKRHLSFIVVSCLFSLKAAASLPSLF